MPDGFVWDMHDICGGIGYVGHWLCPANGYEELTIIARIYAGWLCLQHGYEKLAIIAKIRWTALFGTSMVYVKAAYMSRSIKSMINYVALVAGTQRVEVKER